MPCSEVCCVSPVLQCRCHLCVVVRCVVLFQMQNPEVQQVMTNPQALQAIMQIQQGIHTLQMESPNLVQGSVSSLSHSLRLSLPLSLSHSLPSSIHPSLPLSLFLYMYISLPPSPIPSFNLLVIKFV